MYIDVSSPFSLFWNARDLRCLSHFPRVGVVGHFEPSLPVERHITPDARYGSMCPLPSASFGMHETSGVSATSPL